MYAGVPTVLRMYVTVHDITDVLILFAVIASARSAYSYFAGHACQNIDLAAQNSAHAGS
jgi:hypothetical protein